MWNAFTSFLDASSYVSSSAIFLPHVRVGMPVVAKEFAFFTEAGWFPIPKWPQIPIDIFDFDNFKSPGTCSLTATENSCFLSFCLSSCYLARHFLRHQIPHNQRESL